MVLRCQLRATERVRQMAARKLVRSTKRRRLVYINRSSPNKYEPEEREEAKVIKATFTAPAPAVNIQLETQCL